TEFMEAIAEELIETGVIEDYEYCHYRAQRGMRVDGYWFNDEGVLDLYIADFDSRKSLDSLTKTETEAAFKRLLTFFSASISKPFYADLEESTPEYGLSREIFDRKASIRRVNLFLFSERALSDRLQKIDESEI